MIKYALLHADYTEYISTFRTVASLSLLGGQDNNISSIFSHFPLNSLIFPQIFFLILVFWVGGLPTREGPGYATVYATVYIFIDSTLISSYEKLVHAYRFWHT